MSNRGELHSSWKSLGFTVAGLVLLLASGACSSPASKALKECKAACPMAVLTACGGSGKEYDNSCLAKCAGETQIDEGNCSVAAAKAKKTGG